MRFFHIHKWSKWAKKEEGSILRQGTDFVIGTYYVQSRECENCGKIQIKETRY
jgi:hypothetical protein